MNSELVPAGVEEGLDWAGRGTSHVEFDKDDVLPLAQVRFLGHGVNGGVYETECHGIRLAWKRRYCRKQIGIAELREMNILKKLDHRHIIKLVGTYTHGPFLGLLLWPVAVCDLGAFMEDVDSLIGGNSIHMDDKHIIDRLRQLGMDVPQDLQSMRATMSQRLKQSICCTSSAVAYLHTNSIRHKDLKPSNILLYAEGLRVTDFGTSTDFSYFTESVTQNGERGTPKYFAPEVAAFEPSGRSADIFSLGCVFFEMVGLCNGHSLEDMKVLRPKRDHSFHANLESILDWFNFSGTGLNSLADQQLMTIVRQMLSGDADERPTALEVENRLRLIDAFSGPSSPMLWAGCCKSIPGSAAESLHDADVLPVTIAIGNRHHRDDVRHVWKFMIQSSVDVVDKIHVFLVRLILGYYFLPTISCYALSDVS